MKSIRMKMGAIGLTASLAVSMTVYGAIAQEAGEVQVTKVSQGKKLNIRTRPSMKATILGGAASGTVMKSEACEDGAEGRWCKVTLEGGPTGWSSANYLKEGAAMAAAAPAATPAAKPAAFVMGTLKCEKSNGTPAADCSFGVVRYGEGMARLQVVWPDATKRMFGIYKMTVTSASGPVSTKQASDGTYDLSLTPAGAPSEHFMVPAEIMGAK